MVYAIAGHTCACARQVAREAMADRQAELVPTDAPAGSAAQQRHRGPAATQRIRSRYRVVLVDEFQDTDPVQGQILRAAFHGATTLVLIGDPEQAIYAFRGADLVTYLRAAGAATTRRTLAATGAATRACSRRLRRCSAARRDRGIVARPVAAEHTARRLAGAGPRCGCGSRAGRRAACRRSAPPGRWWHATSPATSSRWSPAAAASSSPAWPVNG